MKFKGKGISRAGPALIRLFLILGLFVPAACDSGSSGTDPDPEDSSERLLTVLYTSDEHGWIEQAPGTEGAARLMGLWRAVEGYEEGGDFLVLSGGDSWTGRAISTWFDGASTVAVMNAMGYGGSAIGNHEFDFGLDALRDRIDEAGFPFLASNIRLKLGGAIPDFATPFSIRNVNGLRVGLVGLASTSTPFTTFPTHVEGYDFIPYADALTEYVPLARAAGADLVVVVAHLCQGELIDLEPVAQELGVSVILGGHCHQVYSEIRNGVALLTPGWRFANYGIVTIRIGTNPLRVLAVQPQVKPNVGGSPDPEVDVVVQHWQNLADAELSSVVGHVSAEIPNYTPTLHNLVTDSWLFAYPAADIVMTNDGGIRQGIPAGDITKGTIVGMLPFPNNLIDLDLTGSEVIDCLKPSTILAGMTTVGGYLHSDGTPLKMDSVYHVVTTDFLYAQPSYNYRLYDQTPYEIGIIYFQPTLTYLEALGTTPGNPLDPFLDHNPRR